MVNKKNYFESLWIKCYCTEEDFLTRNLTERLICLLFGTEVAQQRLKVESQTSIGPFFKWYQNKVNKWRLGQA